MTCILTATITHHSWHEPVQKTMKLTGETLDDILDKIECPVQHKLNLKHHGSAGFVDARGIKHRWKIESIEDTTDAEC